MSLAADNKGILVSHAVFGEGEVIDERFRGQEFFVKFKTGLRLWLRKERLLFLTPPTEKEIDLISARRIVEAFRLGIVPRRDIDDFTFGRDAEIHYLKKGIERLKEGRGDCILIEGEYGSGKTHLLEYLYHLGIKEGLVVTKVDLDPREVALSRPKKVYRELIHNLRFLDHEREGGFRDLLRKAVNLNIKDHIYFTPLLSRIKRVEENEFIAEVFYQWVEAESTKEYAVEHNMYRIKGGQNIPALYDFATAADFYCYLISGISYIGRELGFSGLLLLLDEAESVTHFWDVAAFQRGMNFLDGLVKTSLNYPELKRINRNYLHNGMRPTPYIYKDSYILLVIATTPLPNEYTYLRLKNVIRKLLTLAPLKEDAMKECFYNLLAIYKAAYPNFRLSPLKENEILISALKQETLRDFIKYTIDFLDCERHRVPLTTLK